MKTNNIINSNELKRAIENTGFYSTKNTNVSHEEKNKQSDILDISEQGKKLSREFEDFIKKIKDKKTIIEMLKASREDLNKENEMDIKIKCFKIYLRIIDGDEVPAKDKRYLMEHEPGLYTNAMLFKKQNNNPIRHKSLVKDDDGYDIAEMIENMVEHGDGSAFDK